MITKKYWRKVNRRPDNTVDNVILHASTQTTWLILFTRAWNLSLQYQSMCNAIPPSRVRYLPASVCYSRDIIGVSLAHSCLQQPYRWNNKANSSSVDVQLVPLYREASPEERFEFWEHRLYPSHRPRAFYILGLK